MIFSSFQNQTDENISGVSFFFFSKSQFRDEYTLEQIMESRPVHDPLTKLQCCKAILDFYTCIYISVVTVVEFHTGADEIQYSFTS